MQVKQVKPGNEATADVSHNEIEITMLCNGRHMDRTAENYTNKLIGTLF